MSNYNESSKQQVHASMAAQGRQPSVLSWLSVFSKRQLALLGLLLLLCVSALGVVLLSYESRSTFLALQQQRELNNQLNVEWGQLLIEQSTFGLESRIERRAAEELKMQVPDWSRIVMVRDE